MKKLSYYLLKHKFSYLFVFVSMVIAVSLDLLTPQVTRIIVDDVIQGGRHPGFVFCCPASSSSDLAAVSSAIPRSIPPTSSDRPSPRTSERICSLICSL